MQKKQGVLAVISGFSGVGKGTVVKRLVEEYGYALSVSATTRDPRPGEIADVSYHYLTTKQFEELIAKDGFLEWAKYVDHYYGTPKKFVLDTLNEGKDVILEIESEGAFKVKQQYPDACLIYMLPPSFAEVKRRLEGRGTETADKIKKRLTQARDIELERAKNYDYLIVNDEVESCVKALHELILTKEGITPKNSRLLDELTEEAAATKL